MGIVKENGKWKNLKLADIPLMDSVVVEKIFENTFEGNGKFGVFYTTKVKCEGMEDVGLLLSSKQNDDWSKMPLGKVTITKSVKEIEFKNRDGGVTKKPVSIYTFESGEQSSNSTQPIKLTPSDLTDMEKEILEMCQAKDKDVFETLMATLTSYKAKFPDKIGDISEERVRSWL